MNGDIMKQISSSVKTVYFFLYLIIASINATASSSGDDTIALKNRVTTLENKLKSSENKLTSSENKLTALENKLTTSNLMLSQIYKEFTDMKADMKDKLSKHGICQIMKNAPCGDCRCIEDLTLCLLYTSPSPRDATLSRMPSSA